MTTTPVCIHRPVVMYLFLAPSQRLVRWTYPSIRHAKKEWSVKTLLASRNRMLQPWIGCTAYEWRAGPDGAGRYQTVHDVHATTGGILRYQGGALVPHAAIASVTPYKKRRNRPYKEERPAQRALARRLRGQQRMDEQEPFIRSSQRVHRTYYEDAWVVRDTDRSWKRHRKTQRRG